MCKAFAPNFGDKRTGCCITKTYRLTLPFSPIFSIFDQQHGCRPHSPTHFSLFSLLKINLRGLHFDTIEVIEAESQAVLNIITEHDFKEAVTKW
jgi:hypothetical protein